MAVEREPLRALAEDRKDELTPGWTALIGLLRFWFGLFGFFGPATVVVFSLQLMWWSLERYGSIGVWSYFVVAMPGTALLVLGMRGLRRFLARRIADAIRARLDGIGGALTPASFSLGPRKEDAR